MDEETIKRLYEAGWFVGDAEDFLADLLAGSKINVVKGRKGKSDKYTFDDKRKMTDD